MAWVWLPSCSFLSHILLILQPGCLVPSSIFCYCASAQQQNPCKCSLAQFLLAQQAAIVPPFGALRQQLPEKPQCFHLKSFPFGSKSMRSLRLVAPQTGQEPSMQSCQNAQDFPGLSQYLGIYFIYLYHMNTVISSREMVMQSRETLILVLNLHHLHQDMFRLPQNMMLFIHTDQRTQVICPALHPQIHWAVAKC